MYTNALHVAFLYGAVETREDENVSFGRTTVSYTYINFGYSFEIDSIHEYICMYVFMYVCVKINKFIRK